MRSSAAWVIIPKCISVGVGNNDPFKPEPHWLQDCKRPYAGPAQEGASNKVQGVVHVSLVNQPGFSVLVF